MINIDRLITLKHIVLGYKLFGKDCFDFNYFLTVIGISIYKSYYVSEQKTKNINVYNLFKHKYNTRIKDNMSLLWNIIYIYIYILRGAWPLIIYVTNVWIKYYCVAKNTIEQCTTDVNSTEANNLI